jgi:hypothetical protein
VLRRSDLGAARAAKKVGRGTLALELTGDGMEIHFADPQPGADHYRIEISLTPRATTTK